MTEPLVAHVPRLIHMIWLGGRMPTRYARNAVAWQLLHPDWDVLLWDDEEIEALPLRNQEIFSHAAHYVSDSTDVQRFRADVARLEILERFGGLYVDCDTEPRKSVEPLRSRYPTGFVVRSPNSRDFYVTNAVIAAQPEDPAILDTIDLIPARVSPGRRVVDQVGPGPLTEVVLERRGHHRDREGGFAPSIADTVLPPHTFGPQSITQRRRGEEPVFHDDTYAFHRWDASRERDGELER